MNKKYILTILSGSLLLANVVLGETKDKKEVDLDDMETPKEVDVPKKSKSPFLKQEKKLVKHFDTAKTNDVFALDKEDPFMDTDPWDN